MKSDNIIFVLIVALILGGVAYAGYKIKRYVNWNFGGYDSEARELVCDMVKPSALKDPSICE